MALFRRKPNVIEVVQFDPSRKPWPAGIETRENCIGGRGHGRIPIGVYYVVPNDIPGFESPLDPGDWVDITDPHRPRVIPRKTFEAQYEPFGGNSIREFVQRTFHHHHRAACAGKPAMMERFDDLIGYIARIECATCGDWFEAGPSGYQQDRESQERLHPVRINRPYDTGGEASGS
jgi:hypothetical protein